jgi:hypothetical protein
MIRVSGGLYDGREGMIMRVKGKRKKQFVVSIPGILIASVELESDLVEVLSDKSQLSKNIYEDQRLLIKLAKRLLFDIPEAYQHEKEYYLMLSEMKHVASRLSSVKAYIPSREAEFALPLYLAAVKLQQDVESTEQRLRTAIDKLQPTSLLKLRCQMYLAHFSGDADLQIFVEDRIAAIKSQHLSINQRLLLEEFESLQNSHKIV